MRWRFLLTVLQVVTAGAAAAATAAPAAAAAAPNASVLLPETSTPNTQENPTTADSTPPGAQQLTQLAEAAATGANTRAAEQAAPVNGPELWKLKSARAMVDAWLETDWEAFDSVGKSPSASAAAAASLTQGKRVCPRLPAPDLLSRRKICSCSLMVSTSN